MAGALERGRLAQLAADAVASRRVFNRDIALRRMQRAEAELSTIEMLLLERMQDAGHPRFREVTALLK